MQWCTLYTPLASLYWRHCRDGYDVSEIAVYPAIKHFRVENVAAVYTPIIVLGIAFRRRSRDRSHVVSSASD